MKEYADEDMLPLSGIQHFAFCRRQWALIHIEQQWRENSLTIGGDFLHERAHNEKAREKRGGIITARALAVSSRRLGLSGQCDVVEFLPSENGTPLHGETGKYIPFPVEYKSGKAKSDDCDRLQLCAQAMALEEMLACDVPAGALFYGKIRRREEVAFTPELRESVCAAAQEMHALFTRGHTPKARAGKHCKSCSMLDVCLPGLGLTRTAADYIAERVGN
jgi:CRISPR-associated exonuclease Cas4